MEFNDVITGRYSCRKYSNKQISEELLTKILEAGRLAPTAKNLQEQHIYVVRSEKGLEKIDQLTPYRYDANTVLIICYDKNNVYVYPGKEKDSGVEDASIVATHIMLAAYNEGISSCWLNVFNPKDVSKAFNIPENEEVVLMLDLGYAREDSRPASLHYKSKELSEMVDYI